MTLNSVSRCLVLASTFRLLASGTCLSQDLNRKMEVEKLEESQKVNPEADKAYVYVRSQIPNLRFDSNRLIDAKNQISSGDWELWLPAGTHMLKIDADGYQRLELDPYNFAKRRSYELVIRAAGYGIVSRADEDLVEVSFEVNQDSVASSYGDFAPIVTPGRIIAYRLPKGEYTFRFTKRGFRDQTHAITVTKPEKVSLELKTGLSQGAATLALPGFLRISSEPSSAEVIIDGQLIGTTPLQAELTAGTHQLELRRMLHHPDISSFRVEEGRPVALSRSLRPRFGYYAVSSTIPNSSVSLDDKLLGPTPVPRTNIGSGRHKVLVEAPLYHAFVEEFEIKDGDVKTINADLKPAFGFLELNSEPETGADVLLDGKKIGVTPYKSQRLASGRYGIGLKKNLFGDYEDRIIIADSQTVKRTITLSKNYGTLNVAAEFSRITINGKQVGDGSYSARLSPGKYSIQAERGPRYQPASQDVFLAVGESRDVKLDPSGRFGRLSIIVEPNAAGDAGIYVNDHLQGTAPLAFRLLMGDYTLTAKKAGYLDLSQALAVAEGDMQSLRLKMITYEGSRQATKDQWGTVKWISGGACLLAGGSALYFKSVADEYYSKYQSATLSTDAASYRDKTNSNDKLRKIALGAAVGLGATAIITWIVQEAS